MIFEIKLFLDRISPAVCKICQQTSAPCPNYHPTGNTRFSDWDAAGALPFPVSHYRLLSKTSLNVQENLLWNNSKQWKLVFRLTHFYNVLLNSFPDLKFDEVSLAGQALGTLERCQQQHTPGGVQGPGLSQFSHVLDQDFKLWATWKSN